MNDQGNRGNQSSPARDLARQDEDLWSRLEELLARVETAGGAGPTRRRGAFGEASASGVRRGVAGLDPTQIGELGRLYRAATTRLAQLQTFGGSARRLAAYHRLVARAHAVVYVRPERSGTLRRALTTLRVFPLVVRRTLPFHGASFALLLVGGLYGYFGALSDPEWALLFIGDERIPYASRAELHATLLAGRTGHESLGWTEKSGFALFLWMNNTRVALLGFFAGIAFGLPTVFVLLANGALLGVYTATFVRAGLGHEWWAWILPHGVTELLAVVLFCGGGLALGFRALVPGEITRVRRLAASRGEAFYFLVFVFPMLLLAALIESFVRQSDLSDTGRYVFALVSAAFWVVYLGLVRPPRELLAVDEGERTLTEARVPLPSDAELMLADGRRRSAESVRR